MDREKVVGQLRETLPQVGIGTYHEVEPGHFILQRGSTHVDIQVINFNNMPAVRSVAPVTIGSRVDADLMRFLLEKNAGFAFGAFGVDARGIVIFSHTILATSMGPAELAASVNTVLATADQHDDQIVAHWGGKTGKQVAMEQLVAPGLLKALMERRAALADALSKKHPPSPQPPVHQQTPNLSDAIKVGSVAEEYMLLARQRCQCGGEYKRDSQSLLEINGLHYDRLDASCKQCGATKSFLFNINSFVPRRR